MKKYKWEYVKSGESKTFMVFCKDGVEVQKLTDLSQALKIQEQYTDELENDVMEYATDQRDAINAAWNKEKYQSKINFIKNAEWTKIQSKFKKKDKQTEF